MVGTGGTASNGQLRAVVVPFDVIVKEHEVYDEDAVLESRSVRASLFAHQDALVKVKVLRLLPDETYVTRNLLAEYFEVSEEAIHSLVRRHRDELSDNGYRLLRGAELQEFQSVNMTDRTRVPGTGLGIFPRRAVLNVAMLLRHSLVAQQVRRYLVDAESGGAGFGPVGRQLERAVERAVDKRLAPHTRIIAAMSNRLCDVQSDVRELRTDVAGLHVEVAELREETGELRLDLDVLTEDVGELRDEFSGMRDDLAEVRTDVRDLRRIDQRKPRGGRGKGSEPAVDRDRREVPRSRKWLSADER